MSSGADAEAPSHRVLRRAVGLLRPHRRRVAALVATIVAGALLGAAAPLVTKLVFDSALFPPDREPRLGLLAALVGLTVVLVALAGAAGILQTYLATSVGQLVGHDLRDRLYGHLQRMSLRFFTSTRTGEIQSRLSNDVGGLGGVITQGTVGVAANLVFLVASLVAMAVLAWPLAVLSAAMLPVFAYVSHRVGRVRARLSRSTQETLADMTSITEETLSVSGALLSKVFHRHGDAVRRYRGHSRRLADLRVRQEMAGRLALAVAQAVVLVSPALLYLAAGFALSAGTAITPGTLVAFTALQIRMFGPVRDLLTTSIQLQASAPLFERVFAYLDLPQEIAESPNARALDPERVRGAVSVRGVSFAYGAPGRARALEDVSLEVAPGQLAALVGPSGAGKTTLTYLLARLYDVHGGSIAIDGVDVREIRLESLARLIGMVTQETHLFHASIRDNLLYAKPDATREEIEAAARVASIHDRIAELEHGYDTVVGERGYRMSGGEKQRLAIARVVLRDPRILILDEATSSLDTENERLVQSSLQPLMAQRTTIAIAHRLSTILAADVIFVLDRGRVVERGTHAELVAGDGLYARLHRRQFEGGLVEARCEDGVVLADGDVVSDATALRA